LWVCLGAALRIPAGKFKRKGMEMKRNAGILFVATLLFVSIPVLSQDKPPDISGEWEITFETPDGSMATDITFAQEGEVIKVSMMSPDGMEMTGEGTVKDKDIQWVFTISMPDGDFTLIFKGELSGEEMTGEADAGDFGIFGWTAKKKKNL
jgi:hypothetical protein